MSSRRPLLYLAFGLPIAGALAGSYLHLAAWLVPWMPPGYERLAWLAALALDGLVLAPIVARQIVGADVTGAPLRLAQGVGIGASVYVNARWGAATMAPVTAWQWADVAVGAAILPVLALIGEHAMRATLAALQAQEARQMAPPAPVRRAITAPSPAAVAPPALEQTAPSAPSPIQPPRHRPAWAELVARYGDSPRAIAEGTGTPLRTVQRWRQQAAPRTSAPATPITMPARMPASSAARGRGIGGVMTGRGNRPR